MARYLREGRIAERPHSGRNNARVDNDMKECLSEIISENFLLSLTQINGKLRRRLPRKPHIHDRTVARALDGMLLRVKLARSFPVERNRPDVIQRRIDYANWFLANGVQYHYVFEDECEYNIWTVRNHGRARRGQKEPTDKCAASVDEMLLFGSLTDQRSRPPLSMNAQRFSEFLR